MDILVLSADLLQCLNMKMSGFLAFSKVPNALGRERWYSPLDIANAKGYSTISQLLKSHRVGTTTTETSLQNQHQRDAPASIGLTERSLVLDMDDPDNSSHEDLFRK